MKRVSVIMKHDDLVRLRVDRSRNDVFTGRVIRHWNVLVSTFHASKRLPAMDELTSPVSSSKRGRQTLGRTERYDGNTIVGEVLQGEFTRR